MHIINPYAHREFRVLYPTATIGTAVGTAVGGLSTSVQIHSPPPDELLPQPSRAIEGAASEHPSKRKQNMQHAEVEGKGKKKGRQTSSRSI